MGTGWLFIHIAQYVRSRKNDRVGDGVGYLDAKFDSFPDALCPEFYSAPGGTDDPACTPFAEQAKLTLIFAVDEVRENMEI